MKQRLSRYELPEGLRLEHDAGEHDAFDDRYRGMARSLDQHLKDHLPRYIDRIAYERHIDHMDVDIFASTELELERFSDCIGRELLELSKCSAFSRYQGSALARRFHMIAWSRMSMYEEDVDSERMHLDEGRVYELNIVFDEMLNEAVRETIQKQNAEANATSNDQQR